MSVHPLPTSPVGASAIADLADLRDRFGARVPATDAARGEAAVVVPRDAIVEVATYLRDARGYQLLRSVTAVDFLPAEPRYQVVYHLTALPPGVIAGDATPDPALPARLLRVKVPLAGDDAVLPSLVGVFPTANWHEREVYDLFGIEFAGHPDLRRILLPATFQGHPLRKDFPLQYEEVTFSHNQAEITRRKPQAGR
jgi:NADH-quinone oxidoreductase subunit C